MHVGRAWIEPSRAVANYRDELRRAEQYERTVERAHAKPPVVYTSEAAPPDKAKRLGELFDSDTAKATATSRATPWWSATSTGATARTRSKCAPTRAGTGPPAATPAAT